MSVEFLAKRENGQKKLDPAPCLKPEGQSALSQVIVNQSKRPEVRLAKNV
jgi:hypothetical protein